MRRVKNQKGIIDNSINPSELDHQVEALIRKFLYEIYKQSRIKKLNRKELAALLEVSPGYLSQIFHSKKPLTFEMLIRFQQVLHIEFDISARAVT
jgi:transcriptional regulator with XRE-family HTH domain